MVHQRTMGEEDAGTMGNKREQTHSTPECVHIETKRSSLILILY